MLIFPVRVVPVPISKCPEVVSSQIVSAPPPPLDLINVVFVPIDVTKSMEAVFAPIAVADMPTVKVSKTFAVSGTALLRYNKFASSSVR